MLVAMSPICLPKFEGPQKKTVRMLPLNKFIYVTVSIKNNKKDSTTLFLHKCVLFKLSWTVYENGALEGKCDAAITKLI